MEQEVTFTLDGRSVKAPAGANLLQVARENGIDIPSLCYDPRLEPYGACRLCLVELEGARGPVPACATFIKEGMNVVTESPALTKMRRTNLELLLSEHCGDCISPCQVACPAGIDIQGFIALIASGEEVEAARLIREKLPLPASVGMVCPRFCEQQCRRTLVDEPVSICALKRFAGEADLDGSTLPAVKSPKEEKVAVIGGGPAGISVAYYLSLEGYQVTIYEASPQLGGMMRYGIPAYRLPKDLLQQEIDLVTANCNIKLSTALGRDFDLEGLKSEGYSAVFLGLGAQANQPLGIPGEEKGCVFSGIEFLRRVALGEKVDIGRKVAVIGGGNTAMDAARTAIRLGAEQVKVIYRRTEAEMPANEEEVEQAREEGVEFDFLRNPSAFIGDDKEVTSLECVCMELGEPDASGRCRPVPIAGSEFDMDVDTIIVAAGQKMSPEGVDNINLTRRGYIEVGAGYQTSTPWVFSGGDCVSGPATVVEAIGAARKAAVAIDRYLQGEETLEEKELCNISRGKLEEMDPQEYADKEKLPRTHIPLTNPESRKQNFLSIERGFTPEEARAEAARCLSCGCQQAFDCRLRELVTRLGAADERLGKGKYRYKERESNPYIVQDQNKCVLCGKCVRICQEVQGVGALGLVNRGSQTVVEPSLCLPLDETMCEACGQCISACPTGALTAKSFLPKPGPWQEDISESACTACGVGCMLELRTVANHLNRVTSPPENPVNYGSLCKLGTFPEVVQKGKKRLTAPMVKKDGELQESSWDDALAQAGCLLTQIKEGSKGSRGLGLLVSPRWTNEENYLAQRIARSILQTSNIDSTQPVDLLEGLGGKINLVTFPELHKSDLIVLYRCNPADTHPVVAQHIRRAITGGKTMIIIESTPSRLDSLAKSVLRVNPQNASQLLQAMVSYLSRYKLSEELPEKISSIGMEHLVTLADYPWLNVSKFIEDLRLYRQAEKPVIIFDAAVADREEKELLAALQIETGNDTAPGSGWLPLLPGGNSMGQQLMGVHPRLGLGGAALQADMLAGQNKKEIVDGLSSGDIEGLIICADESPIEDSILDHRGVKIVIAPVWQENLAKADIVLPGALSMESKGSIINCEGRTLRLNTKLVPPGGKDNWEILTELAAVLGDTSLSRESVDEKVADVERKNRKL